MENLTQPTPATGYQLAVNITGLFSSTLRTLCLKGEIPHTFQDDKVMFNEAELRAWMLTDQYHQAVASEKKELKLF